MHENEWDIGPMSFLVLNQLKTEQIISVYTEYSIYFFKYIYVLMPLSPSFYYTSIPVQYYDF